MLKGICPNCELEIYIYEEIIECESCGLVMRVSKWNPLELEEVSTRIATQNKVKKTQRTIRRPDRGRAQRHRGRVRSVKCPACNTENMFDAAICRRCKSRIKVPRGVDKGWHLNYFELSYRRKFIRTLWITPLVPLFLLLPFDSPILGFLSWEHIACLALYAGQVAYTLYRWRTLEA
jgi:hypothetical protein